MNDSPPARFTPGLQGVAVAQTCLSSVDGQAGELTIRGIPVGELAGRASYEEAAFLLWRDALPNAGQLADFQAQLSRWRNLPDVAYAVLREAAAERVPAMDALCMAAGIIGLRAAHGVGATPAAGRAFDPEMLAVVARFPPLAAAYWRLRNGIEPLAPRRDLSHAANYLYMLDGGVPSPARVHALETYLVALIEQREPRSPVPSI